MIFLGKGVKFMKKKICIVILMMINSLILISNENIKFELFNILIVKEKINFRFLSNGLIIKESEGENIKKVQIFSQTRYDINKMADLLEKYDKT